MALKVTISVNALSRWMATVRLQIALVDVHAVDGLYSGISGTCAPID